MRRHQAALLVLRLVVSTAVLVAGLVVAVIVLLSSTFCEWDGGDPCYDMWLLAGGVAIGAVIAAASVFTIMWRISTTDPGVPGPTRHLPAIGITAGFLAIVLVLVLSR